MNVEQKVKRLRENVKAAFEEFTLVMRLYETWRPAAYDHALFRRMGESFASNAFHVIREALQREIVIGLTKLWDTGDRAIRMDRVGDSLRSQAVIRALAVERAASFPFPGVEVAMERDLGAKAEAALAIIDSYLPKGGRRAVHDGLHKLRNTRFAHRQVTADAFSDIMLTTDEVHAFYQDMSALMRHLMSLVLAVAHDPEEFASVHRRYAEEFWAGVRSEKVPGHPNYRHPPSQSMLAALPTGKVPAANMVSIDDGNPPGHTTDPIKADRGRSG